MAVPRGLIVIVLAAVALLAGAVHAQEDAANATALIASSEWDRMPTEDAEAEDVAAPVCSALPPAVMPPCLPKSCAPGYTLICNPNVWPTCKCKCVKYTTPVACVPPPGSCPANGCPVGTICRCFGTPVVAGTTGQGCKCGCLPRPCSPKLCPNFPHPCPPASDGTVRACQCSVVSVPTAPGGWTCRCDCVKAPAPCPCLPAIQCPWGFPPPTGPWPPATLSTCFCNVNTMTAGSPCQCGCNKM